MTSIVVGFDGSEQAQRALERASSLAAGGSVTVVTAVPFVQIATKGPSPVVVDRYEEEERVELLQKAGAWLAEQGVEAHAVEVHGDPAAGIVKAATDAGADLIIVGRHGRHAAATLRLGNVTEKVVKDAPCDVLVIR